MSVACIEMVRPKIVLPVSRRLHSSRSVAGGSRNGYHARRLLVDRLCALLLLGPALPVIGLLVVLVRLTSRGPGLYRQLRVGKDGQTFAMLKLRSMTSDAEASTGAAWSQAGDPRVTPLGRWLRKSHLDELPQLFNVLQGQMAFIGPRPERPEFVPILAEAIPGYLDRLAVLPGVTGLAQINLPADTNLASVRRKLVLDCEYIEQAGVLLDLRILLSTFLRLVGCSGDLSRRLTATHREVCLGGRVHSGGRVQKQLVNLNYDRPRINHESAAADSSVLTDEAAAIETVRPGDTGVLTRAADLGATMRGEGKGDAWISNSEHSHGDRPRKPR